MEEKISDTEDKIEDMDTSIKENLKTKKFQAQNTQESSDINKRLNLMGRKKEVTQVKGTEKNFNKIMEEKFPNLKKEMLIKV